MGCCRTNPQAHIQKQFSCGREKSYVTNGANLFGFYLESTQYKYSFVIQIIIESLYFKYLAVLTTAAP